MIWGKSVVMLIAICLIPIVSQGNPDNEVYGGRVLMDNILWNGIERLTWLGNSTEPVIRSDHNGNYDIAWQDNRNDEWDIYYLKITPWGFKLVNDTRITEYGGDDINPSITAINNYTFVVWQRFVNSHWSIYFARLLYSNENITIDVKPKPLRDISRNCTNPKIGVDTQGFLHVVWQEYVDDNWEIMYDKVDESGNPVFPPIDISRDSTNSTKPDIVVDPQNHVHVLWIDDSVTPGYSVFYRGLDCCGYFITGVRRISVVSPNTTVISYFYGGYLYTTFSCSRENLSYEIIFTKLNDTGVTVMDDKNLTSLDGIDSLYPQPIVFRGTLFLTWYDSPEGIVKFSVFNSYGNISGNVLNISKSNSGYPSISMDDRSIVVVWSETLENGTYLYMRGGNFPNFYVKSMRANSLEESVELNVTVCSIWNINLSVEYSLSVDGNTLYRSQTEIEGEKVMEFKFKLSGGEHNITFVLDPANRIFETSEEDNNGSINIFIKQYNFDIVIIPRYDVQSGNFTNITIGIENEGNWEDTYRIHLNYSRDNFTVNPDNISVSLSPGDYRTLNFTLFCPSTTQIGNHTINISAISVSSGKRVYKDIRIYVEPYLKFQVKYNTLYYALPGEYTKISINILNMGNCNDTYNIWASENENWLLNIENDSVSIPPRVERTVNISVYIPNGTLAFERDIIVLLIESERNHELRNATVGIVVMPHHAVSLQIKKFEKVMGEYSVEAIILNRGNILDFYNLNLTGFLSNYSYLSPYSLLLPPGGNGTVNIEIYPPEDLNAGDYILNLNIYVGNRSILSYPLAITIEARYGYEVSVNKISKGGAVKFDIEIRNDGNAPDTIEIVPFIKSINATWIFIHGGKNYTNETTVMLKPNETVHVLMKLKSKLKDGNYKLYLLFTSSSNINKNVRVSFYVGEKERGIWDWIMGNILYISIGVIAVAAILIYLARRE